MNDSVAADLGRLAVALLIGLLIGVDRERAEERKARSLFAGVRTFPMIALAGCIPMLLVEQAGPLLVFGALLAVAAVVVVAYVRGSAAGNIGATTEVASLATFLLGALAGAGQLILAGAGGVAVSVLLMAKLRLERFSRMLTQAELAAVLELAVISVIVLPVVPNAGYGPWQVLNPRDIWLVVVLVAGVSFAGFVAVRLLGEHRGLAVAGAAGGLVSSTAVTMAMADRSKDGAAVARSAAGAAVLASSIMCVRVAAFTTAINIGLIPRIAPVVGVMAVTGAIAAWLLMRRQDRVGTPASGRIHNPFNLTAALSFAAIYGAVLLMVRAAGEYLGSAGMYGAAALSAVADVDAVTIAFARLGPGSTGWRAPASAVAVALVVNTLVKLVLAVAMGAGVFRRLVATSLGVMAVVGAVTGLAVYLS